MNDLNMVAALYVEAAESSLNARKVGEQKGYRSESHGVLKALEALVGLDEACLLIEQAVENSRTQYNADRLLYDFWSIDRPRRALLRELTQMSEDLPGGYR